MDPGQAHAGMTNPFLTGFISVDFSVRGRRINHPGGPANSPSSPNAGGERVFVRQ